MAALDLIVVVLLPTSVLVHNFWTVRDPKARAAEHVNVLKNRALVYGAAAWPLTPG